MSSSDIITIARQTVWVIVKTSVPLLLVSMVVGLIISLFQTLTSFQDQTLTFGPNVIALLIGLMVGQFQSVYILKVLFFKFENGKVVKQ